MNHPYDQRKFIRYSWLLLISIFCLTQCFAAQVLTEQQFSNAMACFDNIYQIAKKINNEDKKCALISSRDDCRNGMQKEFIAKNYVRVIEEIIALTDKINAILDDCDNEESRIDICLCL
jgi:thioredoxin-related protein